MGRELKKAKKVKSASGQWENSNSESAKKKIMRLPDTERKGACIGRLGERS